MWGLESKHTGCKSISLAFLSQGIILHKLWDACCNSFADICGKARVCCMSIKLFPHVFIHWENPWKGWSISPWHWPHHISENLEEIGQVNAHGSERLKEIKELQCRLTPRMDCKYSNVLQSVVVRRSSWSSFRLRTQALIACCILDK